MNITTKKENTTLTVALEGRLDTTTAPELEKLSRQQMPASQNLSLTLQDLPTYHPQA